MVTQFEDHFWNTIIGEISFLFQIKHGKNHNKLIYLKFILM